MNDPSDKLAQFSDEYTPFRSSSGITDASTSNEDPLDISSDDKKSDSESTNEELEQATRQEGIYLVTQFTFNREWTHMLRLAAILLLVIKEQELVNR